MPKPKDQNTKKPATKMVAKQQAAGGKRKRKKDNFDLVVDLFREKYPHMIVD